MLSRVLQDCEVILLTLLFIYLVIDPLVRFIGLKKKKKKTKIVVKNPCDDDVQEVMAWMGYCDNLWQMRLDWGQNLVNWF